MYWSTKDYLFGFAICTIINIIGMLHFKTKIAIIIGLMWEALLIIKLTQYFIKKRKDDK